MKNLCTKTIKTEYSDVDKNLSLSLFSATNFVQNIMTDLFENIGVTNVFLKRNYNAAWVISKLKIHFLQYPLMNDIVTASAFVTSNSKVRLNIESNFSNQNGTTLFLAKQEICPMDLKTRKVRKLETINYPFDLKPHESLFKNNFSKLKLDIDSFDSFTNYTVLSTDIDFTNHVNNASYVRFILNTFKSDFFDNYFVKDFDIQYINECHEGDCLKIYKKHVDDNFYFVITNNDKVIIMANMVTCPRS